MNRNVAAQWPTTVEWLVKHGATQVGKSDYPSIALDDAIVVLVKTIRQLIEE